MCVCVWEKERGEVKVGDCLVLERRYDIVLASAALYPITRSFQKLNSLSGDTH